MCPTSSVRGNQPVSPRSARTTATSARPPAQGEGHCQLENDVARIVDGQRLRARCVLQAPGGWLVIKRSRP
jgi:hypothetical protein